jgi:glycosyltransferase involved in cell wall biosynthesis
MRVLHITPTWFDPSSILGGGERYATELAQQMSVQADTTLISFGPRARREHRGALELRIVRRLTALGGNPVNPLAFAQLAAIARADVVHVHAINTLVSDLACITSALLRRPAVVTDYGGGSGLVLNHRLPVLGRYRAAIAYSRFGLAQLPPPLAARARLIPGGIDCERYHPDPRTAREPLVLFVGRLLPHKGIDVLIEAFDRIKAAGHRLALIGRVHDAEYHAHLRRLAEGRPVEFVHDADDTRVLEAYRRARVLVLPSCHRDWRGNTTAVPELMGFTLLEAQACGTPVICTDAGAMREFVREGESGRVVPERSAQALAAALTEMLTLDERAFARASAAARACAEAYSWPRVVAQHLALYAELGAERARAASR